MTSITSMTSRARMRPLALALIASLGLGLDPREAVAALQIAVTTTDDAGTTGTCTLRQAIESINAGNTASTACVASTISGVDRIVFDASTFPAGGANTITLADAPDNALSITAQDLVIDASANDQVVVQRPAGATNAFGILYASTTNGSLTIDSVTIANGRLTAAQPSGAALGAGIASAYTSLTLRHCTVTDNHSETAGYAAGGGIAVYAGDLTLIDSTVSNNSVSGNAGASGMGGGVFTRQVIGTDIGGNALVVDSRINGNTANGNGGGLHVGASLTMIESVVSGNTARNGGGMKLYRTSTLSASTISDNNAAAKGGGILAASGYYGVAPALLTINESTLSDNRVTNTSGSRGGAIFSRIGNLSLRNSTLAGNIAATSGFGFGGAIFVEQNTHPITLLQTTLAANTAAERGGGLMIMSSDSGSVTINASLFANTDVPYSGGGNIAVTTGGITIEGSGNLVYPGTPAAGDLINAAFTIPPGNGDPLLSPLADNGGPTLTLLPGAGSAAINALAATGGACATPLDQRGLIRPDPASANVSPTPCDIGAVEAGSLPDRIFADAFEP